MSHLENWLRYHPDYSGLNFKETVGMAPDYKLAYLKDLFSQAMTLNP